VSPVTIQIRPYEPERDEPQAYALWQRTLAIEWPLSQAAFRHKTVDSEVYRPDDHLIAEAGDGVVGFVGTQTRTIPGEPRPRGELMVVMVDPTLQRRGVGRALLEQALTSLRERGVEQVQLGAGGLSYFWAGTPTNLPGAWPFFEACGWTETERSFDLVRELGDYATPTWVYERTQRAGLRITTAEEADLPAILAFEAAHFPRWLVYFERVAAHGAASDIVLAKDAAGQIVGTSYVMDFRSNWQQGLVWQQLLGDDIGGIGPLGVAEAMRGRGIGLALAARVTELLKSRGIATSYIGYTWLVDWYGNLGYRVWREYRMSWKS
jgi:ribosomal protein S18 acetylase RimI-like enzyme